VRLANPARKGYLHGEMRNLGEFPFIFMNEAGVWEHFRLEESGHPGAGEYTA
jgi:hypothetical protein